MAIVSLITALNVQQAAEEAFFDTGRSNRSLLDYLKGRHLRFNNLETERNFYREIFQLTLAVQPLLADGFKD